MFCVHWNLISQILFQNPHFSYARTLRSASDRIGILDATYSGTIAGCSGWDCQRFTHGP